MTSSDRDAEERAGQVIAQAAAMPPVEEIRDLAAQAVRHGGTRDMSLEEIRALADQAVARAEQVTVLLRRLTGLLGDGSPEAGVPGEPGK